MRGPALDLDLRRALRRDVERLAAEHADIALDRCDEWLAGETIESAEEHVSRTAEEPSRDENDAPRSARKGG